MVSAVVAMVRRPVEKARNRRRLEITGPNTIREEEFLVLGGIEQWVTIRGHDLANSVALVIHGGPGSPYTPFNPSLGAWEREFTVVQWDQRGGGRTFLHSGGTAPDLTLNQLVVDGIELAEQLVRQFDRRLLLVGSSVGSLIGAIMAKQRPDLFNALVAANLLASDPDHDGYRLVLEWARLRGNRRAIRSLEQIGPDHRRWTPDDSLEFSKLAIRASEGVPDMVYDLMLPALMYDPGFTMRDIRQLDKGMTLSLQALQPEYENYDFDGLGYDYEVPFVVIQGAGDLVSPVSVARQHFDRISAPAKRFVVVPGAGHLVEFAAPDRFLDELRTTLESAGD